MVTERLTALRRSDGLAVDWAASRARVGYPEAVAAMEARAAAIAAGEAAELVWLIEHPPLYTAGTRAKRDDLLEPDRLPVFESGRGGELTYHGPGQRVAYVMLDLGARGRDLRLYVQGLERTIVGALAAFGVTGVVREGRIGVWVPRAARPEGEQLDDKIAAIGVRVRRWVSFHGLALNVAPDLSHFAGIVPCGVREHGVTSLQALGVDVGLGEADAALRGAFEAVFGATADARPPI